MLAKFKKILQRILGIGFIQQTIRIVNIVIYGVASSTRLTSIVFHWIVFWPFSREQHAFIKAKYHYYNSLNKSTMSKAAMRRNTHRLEKALLMQPRREIFALDYIGRTVDMYMRRVQQYNDDEDKLDRSELEWAHDVLSNYFKAIKPNALTERLRAKFESADFTVSSSEEKSPYLRGAPKPSPVKYEDLMALSMRRRSVRWYLQKKVPHELIDKALLIARQSPSACNRLPYEFRIYDDPELVRKIAATPMGTAGYHQNIPVIIVVVGKLNYYFSSRDRHAIYTDASLAIMAFMYALETLGLASGPINWPDFEPLEIKLQKMLGLAVDERPIMLLSLGYPDPEAKVAFSQKKSLDALRSYNVRGSGVYK